MEALYIQLDNTLFIFQIGVSIINKGFLEIIPKEQGDGQ